MTSSRILEYYDNSLRALLQKKDNRDIYMRNWGNAIKGMWVEY